LCLPATCPPPARHQLRFRRWQAGQLRFRRWQAGRSRSGEAGGSEANEVLVFWKRGSGTLFYYTLQGFVREGAAIKAAADKLPQVFLMDIHETIAAIETPMQVIHTISYPP
jgi:hypothetical protein